MASLLFLIFTVGAVFARMGYFSFSSVARALRRPLEVVTTQGKGRLVIWSMLLLTSVGTLIFCPLSVSLSLPHDFSGLKPRYPLLRTVCAALLASQPGWSLLTQRMRHSGQRRHRQRQVTIGPSVGAVLIALTSCLALSGRHSPMTHGVFH
ncbi:unnamed protein product [Vitrella brassicaformis CCMP3155]|uniref:Uncharacterized protein n=1 Tax=Vitrella brassicaformis (strain CCMP3155) TaxID=1169540 RepID=A0A0G4FQZ0_VITBC|nr:unnamed protein product [Vitrella brassicaformis CCMP3155]|eukprot:CEM16872.1 unnamed protein product [Vitrella brassicaformis CCMP3155]